MKLSRSRKKRTLALAVAAFAASLGVGIATEPAVAATCSDVDIVFARGSGELAGLGITGTPFVNSLKTNLTGKSVSSYAVNYAADLAQTSAGPGATDMTRHVKSVAASCPNTKFVLGGYSQGASVTDISIGIPTLLGSGETIPTNLAPRVAAVVVFGNPLALYGQHIPTASALYGSKAKEYCNLGDPVCAAGVNTLAHLTYGYDGSTTSGAAFAAAKVRALG
ncbi:cutinase family protein [Parafrankia sp. EUN1f]|uniref:cutinase family protein n=1 Tax=Parafrankia sp. EUN1f TaxID=102897 RepID=UPI0001C4600C|nr:cutinase family protein [Parafrankia sp. EUN1f]EFC81230.1 Cutinase [Parafrankia sp. EUN1f]